MVDTMGKKFADERRQARLNAGLPVDDVDGGETQAVEVAQTGDDTGDGITVETASGDGEPETVSVTESAELPVEPVKVIPKAEDETLEHRLEVVSGMLKQKDSEKQAALNEKADLEAKVTQLSSKVIELLDAADKAKLLQNQTQETVVAQPAKIEPLITVEELNEDEKLVIEGMESAIAKIAKIEFSAFVSALENRIKTVEDALRSELAGVKTIVDTAEQKSKEQIINEFTREVSARVPNCTKIEASPDFQAWLQEKVDKRTGIPYGSIYAHAVNETRDVDVTVDFFAEYFKDRGIGDTVPDIPNTNTVTTNNPSAVAANDTVQGLDPALADQIAPPRSTGSEVVQKSAKKPPTVEDVQNAVTEWCMGRITEEKLNSIKAQYYAALQAANTGASKK